MERRQSSTSKGQSLRRNQTHQDLDVRLPGAGLSANTFLLCKPPVLVLVMAAPGHDCSTSLCIPIHGSHSGVGNFKVHHFCTLAELEDTLGKLASMYLAESPHCCLYCANGNKVMETIFLCDHEVMCTISSLKSHPKYFRK
jgi:hypothetical protein